MNEEKAVVAAGAGAEAGAVEETGAMRLPGDVVRQAVANLPERQRAAILWLHAHAQDNELSLAETGRLVRRDGSTISRVFRGMYNGSIGNVVDEIEAYQRDLAEQLEAKKHRKEIGYIEISLSHKIWKACRKAKELNKVVFLFGDSHTGKTAALLQHQKTNPADIIYCRVPAGGSVTAVLDALARALRITSRLSDRELRWRIKDSIDSRMILLIDEAHQCLQRAIGVRSFEYLREVHDDTKCGMVLCATNALQQAMQIGPFANVLRQFWRRSFVPVQLPNVPNSADQDTIARAYGLPPAKDKALALQQEMLREHALGMWLTILGMAHEVASKRRVNMTWEHVRLTHAGWVELGRVESN